MDNEEEMRLILQGRGLDLQEMIFREVLDRAQVERFLPSALTAADNIQRNHRRMMLALAEGTTEEEWGRLNNNRERQGALARWRRGGNDLSDEAARYFLWHFTAAPRFSEAKRVIKAAREDPGVRDLVDKYLRKERPQVTAQDLKRATEEAGL